MQENWPVIKMTSDYKIALRYNFETQKIESYDTSQFLKLRDFEVGIIDSFFLHPQSIWEEFSVICFTMEKMQGFKKTTGRIQLCSFNVSQPLLTKDLPDCARVQCLWSQRSKKLLIKTESNSDESNKSYYGKTNLWYMNLEERSKDLILQKIETTEVILEQKDASKGREGGGMIAYRIK